MIKDIAKGFSWGLSILTLIIILLIAVVNIFNNAETFNTSKNIEQYKLATEVLIPKVKSIQEHYEQFSNVKGYYKYQDLKLKAMEEDVRTTLDKVCAECYRIKLFYPSSTLDVSNYISKLEQYADKEKLKNVNSIVIFNIFFSFITILISIYLFYAFIKYKKVKAAGIATLVFLTLPILTATFSLMTVGIGEYLEMNLSKNEINIPFVILSSIFYIFVIYPIIFILSKKNKINITNLILFRN